MNKSTICILVFLFNIVYTESEFLPKIKLKDLNNKRSELSLFYADGPIAINVWNMSCEPI